MAHTTKTQIHLLCLDNEGYPASLERGKIYRRKSDSAAESAGYWRVIDESGEDYLYEKTRFVGIDLPKGAGRLFQCRRAARTSVRPTRRGIGRAHRSVI